MNQAFEALVKFFETAGYDTGEMIKTTTNTDASKRPAAPAAKPEPIEATDQSTDFQQHPGNLNIEPLDWSKKSTLKPRKTKNSDLGFLILKILIFVFLLAIVGAVFSELFSS